MVDAVSGVGRTFAIRFLLGLTTAGEERAHDGVLRQLAFKERRAIQVAVFIDAALDLQQCSPAGAHATCDEVRAKNQEVQEQLRVLQAGMRRRALDPITASSERVRTAIAGRMARIPGIEKLSAEVSKPLRSPQKRLIDEVAGALKRRCVAREMRARIAVSESWPAPPGEADGMHRCTRRRCARVLLAGRHSGRAPRASCAGG